MDVQSLANSFVRFNIFDPDRFLARVKAQSILLDHIKAIWFEDMKLKIIVMP